ncbi:Surfactin synthase thioesterase subunit [Sporomusa ovata DSM 2662]|uniref:Probable cadicidin biosynthesis thioesterase (Protein X) (ORF-1) n=1 Tax=Sporomusa ovata TaxID=2378 RepID=A0A0U1KRZ8_9FIRM|nr:alpha/beta fold hydrolase [Sporomusa ovata]EQB24972.1 putative thioesterase involved in non-ribosomal peptide biosynthesis [Sporomusa ovata DSM 2662]CQR70172.1 Probable cadicidin biosynthesis thioesterase (Protein X) (ORF-1) [Sporomusa ovata]
MQNHSLISLKSNPASRGTLICFPYACGNASMFYHFSQALNSDINVLGAVMPGHGGSGELPASIEQFAVPFVRLTEIQQKPVFILGYSFGGFIAFELVRKILGSKGVAGLILVGSPPPGITKEMDYILTASNDELHAYTVNCYKFNLGLLTPEERKSYFALLRNDTRAMRNYAFPNAMLKIDTLVLLGEQEEEMEMVQNIKLWGKYLTPVTYATLPGGHTLIKSYPQALAEAVNQFIERQLNHKQDGAGRTEWKNLHQGVV